MANALHQIGTRACGVDKKESTLIGGLNIFSENKVLLQFSAIFSPRTSSKKWSEHRFFENLLANGLAHLHGSTRELERSRTVTALNCARLHTAVAAARVDMMIRLTTDIHLEPQSL